MVLGRIIRLKRYLKTITYQSLLLFQGLKKPDSKLEKWSKKLSVDLISYENVNSPQAVAKFQKYNADLFVSMSFDQILKKDIILLPKMGFFVMLELYLSIGKKYFKLGFN